MESFLVMALSVPLLTIPHGQTSAETLLLTSAENSLAVDSADKQDGSEPSNRRFVIPAELAPHLAPYLECISNAFKVQARSLAVGASEGEPFLSACVNDREIARVNALAALSNGASASDHENPEHYVDGVLTGLESMFLQMEQINRDSVSSVRFRGSYVVPDGMWEYYVCKSLEAAREVTLDGEPVKPRFENDPGCDLSRAYSRQEALEHLQQHGEPASTEERQAMIDNYIAEIDLRFAERQQDYD